jgi:hypothetical protein
MEQASACGGHPYVALVGAEDAANEEFERIHEHARVGEQMVTNELEDSNLTRNARLGD